MRTEPIWLTQIVAWLVTLAANYGIDLTVDQLMAVVAVVQAVAVYIARRRTSSEKTVEKTVAAVRREEAA